MERDMFKVTQAMNSHAADNPLVIDGIVSTTALSPLIRTNAFEFNSRDQIVAGLPLLSTSQRHSLDGFDINHQTTACAMTGTNVPSFASRPMLGRSFPRYDSHNSFGLNGNSNSTEQYAGGVIPTASLATLMMTRNTLQNDSDNMAISTRPLMVSLDSSRTSASLSCSIMSSVSSLFTGEASMRPSSQFSQNVDAHKLTFSRIANAGVDQQNTSSNFNKDLSLTLASSLPFFYGANGHGCDTTICPGGSHYNMTGSGFSSEKNSCHTTELSPGVGAYKPMFSGSSYLQVTQNILAQIASYSVETLDLGQISFTPSGAEAGQISQMSSSQQREKDRSLHELSDMLNTIEVQTNPAGRRSFELKKNHLLALLQIVDESYNQCLDELHTVVSVFRAATELDPSIHVCFALHTVSSIYKNLRERISKRILAIEAEPHGLYPREDRSPETSCCGRQWALQQLKSKDPHFWKPQRGLPERSVVVLRAWMFQNFLHPYPKDSEKHILAIKSGLTRGQVSNWFINARVRLWKPLIEEMYSEMNKIKLRHSEGSNSSNQGHMNANNQS